MPDRVPLDDLEQWQIAMLKWRADVTARIHRMQVRLRVVAVVIVAMIVVLAGAAARIIDEKTQRDRIDQNQFAQLGGLVASIQAERVRNVREGCVEQNGRHDATLAALDLLIERRIKAVPREQRPQVRQSRDATALLIEALVPRRDCDQVVREQTGRSTTP